MATNHIHSEIWITHFQVIFALSYDPTAELHSTWRFELSYSQALNFIFKLNSK